MVVLIYTWLFVLNDFLIRSSRECKVNTFTYIYTQTKTQLYTLRIKLQLNKGICNDGYFIYKLSYSGWTSAGGKLEAGDKWMQFNFMCLCALLAFCPLMAGSPLLLWLFGLWRRCCLYIFILLWAHTHKHTLQLVYMHRHAYTCMHIHMYRHTCYHNIHALIMHAQRHKGCHNSHDAQHEIPYDMMT